jgi:hypothetical protein
LHRRGDEVAQVAELWMRRLPRLQVQHLVVSGNRGPNIADDQDAPNIPRNLGP